MRHLHRALAAGGARHLVFPGDHQRTDGGMAHGEHPGSGQLANMALELATALCPLPTACVLGGGRQPPAHALHPPIEQSPRYLAKAFANRA
ncbi:hypothetical protein D3C72_1687200 [compost metagenome]